jgi:hypothetical protein
MRLTYDATCTENIPSRTTMVTGYVDGEFSTLSKGWTDGTGLFHLPPTTLFPKAQRISMAVSPSSVARIYDTELGPPITWSIGSSDDSADGLDPSAYSTNSRARVAGASGIAVFGIAAKISPAPHHPDGGRPTKDVQESVAREPALR